MPDAPSQQPPHPTVPSQQPPPAQQPALDTLASLQSQLSETQSTLSAHVEKVRALERLSDLGGLAKEHESIKREVSMLRNMMGKGGEMGRDEDGGSDGEDDETRSIATVTPGDDEDARDEPECERPDEEMEDHHRSILGRPRTPEPTMGNMHNFRDEDEDEARGIHDPDLLAPTSSSAPIIAPTPPSPPRNDASEALANRLATLADQLENALAVSRSLQAQQSAAQNTIQLLEAKVVALEDLVHKANTPSSQPPPLETPMPHQPTMSSPTLELLTEWQHGVEKQWSGVREEWVQERVRLDRAREEWEGRVRKVEVNLTTVEEDVKTIRSVGPGNGVAPFAGLVTPPSPRSLSADSTKPRRRKSRSRSGSRRSRSPGRALAAATPAGEVTKYNTNGNGNAPHHARYSDSRSGSNHSSSSDDADRELGGKGDASTGALPLPGGSALSAIRQNGDPAASTVDQRHRPGLHHVVSSLLARGNAPGLVFI